MTWKGHDNKQFEKPTIVSVPDQNFQSHLSFASNWKQGGIIPNMGHMEHQGVLS